MTENPTMPRSFFLVALLILMLLYLIWNDHKRTFIIDKAFKVNYEIMLKNRELHWEISDLSFKLNKFIQKKPDNYDSSDLPIIYSITPTYTRSVQKAELVRLSQTLCLIPNIHWIVVEDSSDRSDLVTNLLRNLPEKRCAMKRVTHLYEPTPAMYKLDSKDPKWIKPRGVAQRNAGLAWIRENVNSANRGVVYFMDDDNTYDIRIFDEMAKIRNVGVWPVGLVGGMMIEKPIVDEKTGKITSFNSVFKPSRPFPIDMAGFAINVKLIFANADAMFSYEAESGYQESEILKHVTTRDNLEPLADNCTKVYVWHTQTRTPNLSKELLLNKKGIRSDLGIEV